MTMLQISEMAELGNVSTVTLRYYDKIGVLVPEYTNPQTGYRYYTFKQLTNLSVIQFMRSLGFSANEIKKMIEVEDVEEISYGLLLKKEECLAEIRRINDRIALLTQILRGYSELTGHPPYGEPFIKAIHERYLFFFDMPSETFFAPGYSDDYEQAILDAIRALKKAGIKDAGYINIGSIVDSEFAKKGIGRVSRIFSQVKEEYSSVPGVVKVPESIHMCTICNDPQKEWENMKMLYREVQRRDLTPGDYVREEIIFAPHMTKGDRDEIFLQSIQILTDGKRH